MNKQHRKIAQQLIAMRAADRKLRERLIAEGQLHDGYNEEMAALHLKNANQLLAIVEDIGYPSVSLVGEDAGASAWLVAQHAIGSPNFMRFYAGLLTEAVLQREADPLQLAYLTDRIAVFEGQPQHYGTQFDWNENGQLCPQPYDDLNKVNARRQAVGLPPLDEQTEIMRARKENQVAPEDLVGRKKAFERWRERVGWKKVAGRPSSDKTTLSAP